MLLSSGTCSDMKPHDCHGVLSEQKKGNSLSILAPKAVSCLITKTSLPGLSAQIMISAHGCLNKLMSVIPGVFINIRLLGERALTFTRTS